MSEPPFSFSDFPRREGEDINDYMARYLVRSYRPWDRPIVPPPAEVRLPYVEPREPGSDDA
jgi:hypothetical protein